MADDADAGGQQPPGAAGVKEGIVLLVEGIVVVATATKILWPYVKPVATKLFSRKSKAPAVIDASPKAAPVQVIPRPSGPRPQVKVPRTPFGIK